MDKIFDMIMESEMYYSNQIEELVANLIYKNKKLVLLAGPSGSGKTTTANKIVKEIERIGKKAVYLSMDDWFRTKSEYEVPTTEDGKLDFESPICVDIDLLNKDLQNLLNGNTVELPKYDFVNQKMYYNQDFLRIDNTTIIVIEGLHALNPFIKISRDNVFRVYVCPNNVCYDGISFTNEEIRLYRRISRDKLHRGRTIEETIEMWSSVSRGEKLYLKPSVKDIDFNVDSFMGYELYLHKGVLENFDKLEQIKNIVITTNDIPDGSLMEEFYK